MNNNKQAFPYALKIVFITGSGISQESGIDTYRDDNGLWKQHEVHECSSFNGFYNNPQKVLDFHNERRKKMAKASPNLAHQLIADLEKEYNVTVITQNIDNLHERAGSSDIIHLHGNLFECRSVNNIEIIYECTEDLNLGDLDENGIQLRPNVVWFGEDVPNIHHAIQEIKTANLVVVIGTKLEVQPASQLLLQVPNDVEVVYIDPDPSIEEGINLTVIKEKATLGMKTLIELMNG